MISRRLAWCRGLLILLIGASAHAQTLEISKNPNFSTADKAFTFNETLYARVVAPQIDYTNLDKNDYRLKPADKPDDDDDAKGAFTNLLNGTYTTTIILSPLDRMASNWEFRVELKDDDGNEFKTRVNLTIQDNTPLPVVTLTGLIEALAVNSFKVSGKTIFVDAATAVTEIGQPLKFSDLRLNWKIDVRAEKRADSSLWALAIDVLERVSMNDVSTAGRLANLQDSVMIVNDIKFRLVKTTVLQDKTGAFITLGSFRVGMVVGANGTIDMTGKVIATFIKIDDENFVNQTIEFTGTVEGVLARTPLPDSVRINGDIFEVDGQTELRGFKDEPIKAGSLREGESIEIKARTRQNQPALALRLKRREPNGEVQAKGQIERLQESSLVVSGVEFFRAATTIILDDESLLIPFSSLRVGLLVEVRANRQNDGRLAATLVKIDDNDNDEVWLTGFVEALTDTSIKVAGSVFLVDNATVVLDLSQFRIAFSTLRLRMMVEIRGDRRFDGSVLATEIHIEDFLLENEIELRGVVAVLGAGSLQVTNVDFQIEANTIILDLNSAPISFAQLAVGMIAEVRAKFLGNRWLASRVKIEDEIDKEIAVVGPIDSLKTNAFHVLRRFVRATDGTIYLGLNNEPIGFSSLRINDVVSVRGRLLSDSSFIALRVKRENRPANEIEAQGKIMQRGAASVTIAAITFAVDAATSFFDAANRPINFADLRDGQIAEARGVRQINGTYVASRIQLQNHRVLTGVITSLLSATVDIAGLQHVSTAQSVFIDEQNRPISVSAIRPQQQVRLVANAAGGQWEMVNLRILFRGSGAPTGVEDSPQNSLPKNFVLYQNFPNPFFSGAQLNAATVIRFALPRPEEISLTIYNQLGQKVRTISSGRLPAGLHERAWDGRDESGAQMTSGVYFYRLQAGQQTKIQKLVVIR